MTNRESGRSVTPLTNSMRELSTELNPLAMYTLLDIVHNELARDMDSFFTPDSPPIKRRGITIASSHGLIAE